MNRQHEDVELSTGDTLIKGAPTGKMLYLDPWTGVSGDMLLAALLDVSRDDVRVEDELRKAVSSLGLGEMTLEVVRDVERGISCTRVSVHGENCPPLRRLEDMNSLIETAPLSLTVRRRAAQAVGRLAAVEAAVHGCSVDAIHFHEVGAVDTLVDVVGTFFLAEMLAVDKVAVGPIQVGGGTVQIAHGRVGVPAPATLRLLEGYPILAGPAELELTTPTGALLVEQLQAEPSPFPLLVVEKTGYGAGSMRLDSGPNVLRVVVGHEARTVTHAETLQGGADRDTVVHLESNLDDVSPELVGHVCRLVRQEGALDVWTVAAGMKKERHGVVLHVLVSPDREDAAVERIMAETGSLGVRRQVIARWVAARGAVTVTLPQGKVRVKWGRWRGRLVSVAPEYEDAALVSATAGLPVKDVMHLAARAAWDLLDPECLVP